jgi:hypothetical protein
MTREEKLAAFGELTKIPGVKTGRVYADELEDAVQILVPHAAAGRPWRIVGPDAVPGFWHLESSVQLGKDYYNERFTYQRFELVLCETDFTRIQ